MTSEQEETARSDALESLERIQAFDIETLPRKEALGSQLSFDPVVDPARRLVDLFGRITPLALEDFPVNDLNTVKSQSNSIFALFGEILEFDATGDGASAKRQQLINQVENAYQATFKALHPLISYSLHRAADFQRLDHESRALLQEIRDHADDVSADLEGTKEEAKRVLDEVKRVSAEQGVSQQAVHFGSAADLHDSKALEWRTWTVRLAVGLGLYSLLTVIMHKLPWIAPTSTYDTVQLAVSKVLVFGVISYMLYLCARNFLSHKHNAVVNRHRQNALMTYRALVEAGQDPSGQDTVLNHAAACIFAPQPTGYAGQQDGQAPSAKSIVELMGRPLTGSD